MVGCDGDPVDRISGDLWINCENSPTLFRYKFMGAEWSLTGISYQRVSEVIYIQVQGPDGRTDIISTFHYAFMESIISYYYYNNNCFFFGLVSFEKEKREAGVGATPCSCHNLTDNRN